jgi:hypothetical protein
VRPNRSEDRVRLAQYISMFPADPENVTLREGRIKTWREQTAPIGDAFPGGQDFLADGRCHGTQICLLADLGDMMRRRANRFSLELNS